LWSEGGFCLAGGAGYPFSPTAGLDSWGQIGNPAPFGLWLVQAARGRGSAGSGAARGRLAGGWAIGRALPLNRCRGLLSPGADRGLRAAGVTNG